MPFCWTNINHQRHPFYIFPPLSLLPANPTSSNPRLPTSSPSSSTLSDPTDSNTMKGGTLQINWHDTKPVLTLDFHSPTGLLATGGADHDIKVFLFFCFPVSCMILISVHRTFHLKSLGLVGWLIILVRFCWICIQIKWRAAYSDGNAKVRCRVGTMFCISIHLARTANNERDVGFWGFFSRLFHKLEWNM